MGPEACGRPESGLPNWRDSADSFATGAVSTGVPPRERAAKVEASGLQPAPRGPLPTGNDMSLPLSHRPGTRARRAPLTILFAGLLATAALALAPTDAWSQVATGGVTGTTTGTLGASDFFLGVQQVEGVNLTPANQALFLNRASCDCQRTAWLRAVLYPASTAKAVTVPSTATVSMYLGNLCNNRFSILSCLPLKSVPFSEFKLSGMQVMTSVDVHREGLRRGRRAPRQRRRQWLWGGLRRGRRPRIRRDRRIRRNLRLGGNERVWWRFRVDQHLRRHDHADRLAPGGDDTRPLRHRERLVAVDRRRRPAPRADQRRS